jgi:two-component system response regulator PilR (NtrC family)
MKTVDGDDAGDLVGISDNIRRIQALIGKYAIADATVLITGESGTGKEVAARLIHRYSVRSKGPFVAVNCGALPENLLESELFGFEKGSFTGASSAKRGLFEEAKGGIIFLDEIGEMPIALQVKLLRVLQELKVRRIGSGEERLIDVRVICATNRNIKELAEKGDFRQDLYYRLNILHLEIPTLRERLEDLPAFVNHFLTKACKRQGKPPMTLTQDAMKMLSAYSFPGNVRELENLMERFAALGSGGALDSEVFPDSLLAELEAGKQQEPVALAVSGSLQNMVGMPEEGFDLEMYLRDCKSFFMGQALGLTEGNKTKAAHMLGMVFSHFRYWLDGAGGLDALPKHPPSPVNFPLKQPPKEKGT